MNAAQEFITNLVDKISMPDVYLKIRTMMEDPKATISHYVAVVESDPMLAIRVTRIANSGFFGFNRKAGDLYDAISLIGVIQLHDLLLSSLCMRAFYNIPEQILNFNDFWRYGVRCGIASKSISKLCRIPASNRYFTLGLLLEIGHAVMFIKKPELALKALFDSRQENRPITEVERDYFGFDYCQVGSALMRQWHLPEVYQHIIEHHLSPGQSKPDFQAAAEIVNLAHRLCETPNQQNTGIFQVPTNHQQFELLPKNFANIINDEISRNLDPVFALLSPPNLYDMTMSRI